MSSVKTKRVLTPVDTNVPKATRASTKVARTSSFNAPSSLNENAPDTCNLSAASSSSSEMLQRHALFSPATKATEADVEEEVFNSGQIGILRFVLMKYLQGCKYPDAKGKPEKVQVIEDLKQAGGQVKGATVEFWEKVTEHYKTEVWQKFT